MVPALVTLKIVIWPLYRDNARLDLINAVKTVHSLVMLPVIHLVLFVLLMAPSILILVVVRLLLMLTVLASIIMILVVVLRGKFAVQTVAIVKTVTHPVPISMLQFVPKAIRLVLLLALDSTFVVSVLHVQKVCTNDVSMVLVLVGIIVGLCLAYQFAPMTLCNASLLCP